MAEDNIKRMTINNVHIWIVKMPSYISTSWYNMNPGDTLAVLHVRNMDGKSTITFSKALESLNPSMVSPVKHMMREFTLEDMKDWAYSSTEPYGKMTIEGCLRKKMQCVPIFNKYYKTLLKSKFEKAHQRRRVLCLSKIARNIPARVDVNLSYNPNNNRRFEQHNRLSAFDLDAVKSKILFAYDKREFYTILELQKITKQPFVLLKPIMLQMCTYIKTFPNKFTWALKEEYQRGKKAEFEEIVANAKDSNDCYDSEDSTEETDVKVTERDGEEETLPQSNEMYFNLDFPCFS